MGPLLAQALGLPWLDTDLEISRATGKTIPEIFQLEGEEAFREKEAGVLAELAAGPASVISCGGGIVLREANRKILASTGTRIYLQADPATLSRRLQLTKDRPLLSGTSAETALTRQLAQRTRWYQESEIQVEVSHLTPGEVTAAIRQKLPAP